MAVNPATDHSDSVALKECRSKAKAWFFGLPFRPMDQVDRDGFAGASEGSLICFPDDLLILIYDPVEQTMSEINVEQTHGWSERVWKFEIEM